MNEFQQVKTIFFYKFMESAPSIAELMHVKILPVIIFNHEEYLFYLYYFFIHHHKNTNR